MCHVLHLVDDEWVIKYRPRGRVGASGRYLSRPTAVVDYDPRWAPSLRAERRLILVALGGWCLPLARPSLGVQRPGPDQSGCITCSPGL